MNTFLRAELPAGSFSPASAFDQFSLHKKVAITVRPTPLGSVVFQDRIRAIPASSDGLPASLRKLARKVAYFDTAVADMGKTLGESYFFR